MSVAQPLFRWWTRRMSGSAPAPLPTAVPSESGPDPAGVPDEPGLLPADTPSAPGPIPVDATKENAISDTLWGPGFLLSGKGERYNPDLLVRLKGWSIYERMLRDDQIAACLAIVNAAVSSRPWTFEVTDQAAQGPAVDFLRFNLGHVLCGTVQQLLDKLLTARVFGFALVEKVYGEAEWQGRPYWALTAFKLRPAWSFTFRTDPYGNVQSLVQNQGGARVELDAGRFVHFVHQGEFDPHYGRSALVPAYGHWWSKNNVLKFSNFASLAYQESGAPQLGGLGNTSVGSGLSIPGVGSLGALNVVGHAQAGAGFAGPGVSSFDQLSVGSYGHVHAFSGMGAPGVSSFDTANVASGLNLRGFPTKQLLQRVFFSSTTSRGTLSSVFSTYAVASIAPLSSLSSLLVRGGVYFEIPGNPGVLPWFSAHLMRNPVGAANSFAYLTNSQVPPQSNPNGGGVGVAIGLQITPATPMGGLMAFEAVDSSSNVDPKQYGVDWNSVFSSSTVGITGGYLTVEEWL